MDDSYIFCNYEATFPQSLIIFSFLYLLTLCTTLYTNVVKFPASFVEHITKT
jgi:hypothetical protein